MGAVAPFLVWLLARCIFNIVYANQIPHASALAHASTHTYARNHHIEYDHGIAVTSFANKHLSTNLLTNNGYLSNAYRLHKCDIPPRSDKLILSLLLIVSGDIEFNPGPTEWPAVRDFAGFYPCGVCECEVDWSAV